MSDPIDPFDPLNPIADYEISAETFSFVPIQGYETPEEMGEKLFHASNFLMSVGESLGLVKQLNLTSLNVLRDGINAAGDKTNQLINEVVLIDGQIVQIVQDITEINAILEDVESDLSSKATVMYVDTAIAGEASARAQQYSQITAEYTAYVDQIDEDLRSQINTKASITQLNSAITDVNEAITSQYTTITAEYTSYADQIDEDLQQQINAKASITSVNEVTARLRNFQVGPQLDLWPYTGVSGSNGIKISIVRPLVIGSFQTDFIGSATWEFAVCDFALRATAFSNILFSRIVETSGGITTVNLNFPLMDETKEYLLFPRRLSGTGTIARNSQGNLSEEERTFSFGSVTLVSGYVANSSDINQRWYYFYNLTFVDPSMVEALARAALQLDVNGRITGYEIRNDGSSGDFDIIADKFSIRNPSNPNNSLLSFDTGTGQLNIQGRITVADSANTAQIAEINLGGASSIVDSEDPDERTHYILLARVGTGQSNFLSGVFTGLRSSGNWAAGRLEVLLSFTSAGIPYGNLDVTSLQLANNPFSLVTLTYAGQNYVAIRSLTPPRYQSWTVGTKFLGTFNSSLVGFVPKYVYYNEVSNVAILPDHQNNKSATRNAIERTTQITSGGIYAGKPTYGSGTNGWFLGFDGSAPAFNIGDNSKYFKVRPASNVFDIHGFEIEEVNIKDAYIENVQAVNILAEDLLISSGSRFLAQTLPTITVANSGAMFNNLQEAVEYAYSFYAGGLSAPITISVNPAGGVNCGLMLKHGDYSHIIINITADFSVSGSGTLWNLTNCKGPIISANGSRIITLGTASGIFLSNAELTISFTKLDFISSTNSAAIAMQRISRLKSERVGAILEIFKTSGFEDSRNFSITEESVLELPAGLFRMRHNGVPSQITNVLSRGARIIANTIENSVASSPVNIANWDYGSGQQPLAYLDVRFVSCSVGMGIVVPRTAGFLVSSPDCLRSLQIFNNKHPTANAAMTSYTRVTGSNGNTAGSRGSISSVTRRNQGRYSINFSREVDDSTVIMVVNIMGDSSSSDTDWKQTLHNSTQIRYSTSDATNNNYVDRNHHLMVFHS